MCDYLKIAAKEAKEAKEGLQGKSSLLTRYSALHFSNDNVSIKFSFRMRITFFKNIVFHYPLISPFLLPT